MKKHLLVSSLVLSSLCAVKSNAQTLVHYWNFNNIGAVDSLPTNVINASYSTIDTTTAHVWYTAIPGTSAAYSSYYDAFNNSDSTSGIGASYNVRFGDCSCTSLRTRNPSDSMELLAYMPTTHYQNPVIKFTTESSSVNSGMHAQVYDYSNDNGATWSTAGLTVTGITGNVDSPLAITWMSVNITLNTATDPAIKNNPQFIFRTRFMTNTTGTSGNNRFDNLTMEADTFMTSTAVPVVAAATEPAYTVYPNPVVNTIAINADLEGDKAVTIRNAEGKTAFAALVSGKHISLDVANLAAGVYFVTIRESANGAVSTMKFIKD